MKQTILVSFSARKPDGARTPGWRAFCPETGCSMLWDTREHAIRSLLDYHGSQNLGSCDENAYHIKRADNPVVHVTEGRSAA